MDHVRILNKIRDKTNLERAFRYAVYDRLRKDFYYDCFEIDFVTQNHDSIMSELRIELGELDNYTPRPAYAFYPPKSDLCYRRMIYIPFKDLVIRYAFVAVLAELLDNELFPCCFANRKANGEQAKSSLLQDFASESWPNFCLWQKECVKENNVLLRTDISAFYDSVSHDYLASIIADGLSVDVNTQLIQFFKKLLCIPVISYSNMTGKVEKPQPIRQGLAIGNGTEGFLANLYLKDVDEAMQGNDIEYGRYNDDMRIFGKDRKSVLDAVRTIQELLLVKGLNLNTSKTEIAESKEKIEELRSKDYELYEYVSEEEPIPRDREEIKARIDRSFDEFDRRFESNDELSDNDDAKDFCKFLGAKNKEGKNLLPLSDWTPEYIEKIGDILIRWKGSSKHASWLLVQSAFFQEVPEYTRKKAIKILFNSLSDEAINSYAKYRLMHHIVKFRYSFGDQDIRFLDDLSSMEKTELLRLLPEIIAQPAFELNIMGLYTLWILSGSVSDVERNIRDYVPKPIGDPIKNALSYIKLPTDVPEVQKAVTLEVPDEQIEPY